MLHEYLRYSWYTSHAACVDVYAHLHSLRRWVSMRKRCFRLAAGFSTASSVTSAGGALRPLSQRHPSQDCRWQNQSSHLAMLRLLRHVGVQPAHGAVVPRLLEPCRAPRIRGHQRIVDVQPDVRIVQDVHDILPADWPL